MYVHRRSRTAQEAATAAKGRATEAVRVISEHVTSRDFTGADWGHAGDMDAIARRLEAIAKAIRNGEVVA